MIVSGNGEVIEPDEDFVAIGSGGNYAYSAANALYHNTNMNSEEICREALRYRIANAVEKGYLETCAERKAGKDETEMRKDQTDFMPGAKTALQRGPMAVRISMQTLPEKKNSGKKPGQPRRRRP